MHRRTRILESQWFLDKPSDKVERQAPQASSGELLFVAKTDDESLKPFALWLQACEKADCYLLKENLARLRTRWGLLGKFLLTNGIKWRYEVYRIELRKNPVVACLMTIRNMCYGVIKWLKYVHRP